MVDGYRACVWRKWEGERGCFPIKKWINTRFEHWHEEKSRRAAYRIGEFCQLWTEQGPRDYASVDCAAQDQQTCTVKGTKERKFCRWHTRNKECVLRGLGGLHALISPDSQQEIENTWCGEKALWQLEYLPTQDLLQVQV